MKKQILLLVIVLLGTGFLSYSQSSITFVANQEESKEAKKIETKKLVDEIKNVPSEDEGTMKLRYYYYPNLEAYYDKLKEIYYKWIVAKELPAGMGGYSLYSKVYVTIEDYNGEEPYLLIDIHKKKFPYNAKGRFINNTVSGD
jgi:hypothetical protein